MEQLKTAIENIRSTKPLVLNLTNYVTMDFIANGLLALSAAPIMSVCDAELEELIKMTHSININIGTLDAAFLTRCHKTVTLAHQYNKPLIIDPVGAGASTSRTMAAHALIKNADIIRGNASEIIALYKQQGKTLGVESLNTTEQAKTQAHALAKKYATTVVVSGKKDFIVDNKADAALTFGSSLMPRVTGMGCLLTAVIAAFRAVIPNSFAAAYLAVSYFGLCGNLAELKTDKPGSFRAAFIDELYAADFATMERFSHEF